MRERESSYMCLIAVLAVFNEILLWPNRFVILVRNGMTFCFSQHEDWCLAWFVVHFRLRAC
jgi:hypothetical protein